MMKSSYVLRRWSGLGTSLSLMDVGGGREADLRLSVRTVNSTGDWSAITQEPMIAKGPMLSSCKYGRKHKVVRKSFGAIYGLSLK